VAVGMRARCGEGGGVAAVCGACVGAANSGGTSPGMRRRCPIRPSQHERRSAVVRWSDARRGGGSCVYSHRMAMVAVSQAERKQMYNRRHPVRLPRSAYRGGGGAGWGRPVA